MYVCSLSNILISKCIQDIFKHVIVLIYVKASIIFIAAYVNTNLSVTSQVIDEPLPCPVDTFQCQNGECVIDTARCDNKSHCSDASDESGCGKLCGFIIQHRTKRS